MVLIKYGYATSMIDGATGLGDGACVSWVSMRVVGNERATVVCWLFGVVQYYARITKAIRVVMYVCVVYVRNWDSVVGFAWVGSREPCCVWESRLCVRC